jgi:hypothetical protein
MSLYQASWSTINQQIHENLDLSREEQKSYCSKNYPYSNRSGWAYKSWLKAMKDHFGTKKKLSSQIDLLEEVKK